RSWGGLAASLDRAENALNSGRIVEAVSAFDQYEAEAARVRSRFYIACADALDGRSLFGQSLDLLRGAQRRCAGDRAVATRFAVSCCRQAMAVRADGEIRAAFDYLRQGADALAPFASGGSPDPVLAQVHYLKAVVQSEM